VKLNISIYAFIVVQTDEDGKKASRLPLKEPSFLVRVDMGRSKDGRKGCKTKRVECMGDVYGLHWLDRRKAIDIVENR
jgi:hypothetical protein